MPDPVGNPEDRVSRVAAQFYFFRFALGIVSYGIGFGIPNLAGSIYLNMFIFPAVEIPARFIQPWLLNKYDVIILSWIPFC